MAKLIQVIVASTIRGKGTPDSVMRSVVQYWTPEGDLIFEIDPCMHAVMDEGFKGK